MTHRLLTALVGLGLLAVVGCGGDDGGSTDALPDVAEGPAVAYRLVYAVTTPEASTTEEYEIQRPFDAHVTLRNADGDITAERWSSLGSVVTQSADAPAAGLSVAAAPALSDSRLDRFATELVDAGKATEGEQHNVGGRACTSYTEQSFVGTVPDGATPGLNDATPIRSVVDRCVDAQGIVLQEHWSTPGGERLLTKRAIELEVGDDLELDLEAPEAELLSAQAGNGAFRKLDDATPPPFAEQFSLAPPEAFTHLGRYAVVPPRLRAADGSADDAQLALYTDVWVRGADLLILDQGAGTGGATPFSPSSTWRPITLGSFGQAELAGDTRSAEVRLRRGDGGFVRLAGTVPVDELLALAETIRQETAR